MKQEVQLPLLAKLKSHDHDTYDHSQRVAYYARILAREMQLSKDEIEIIALGALFHDIGKLSISPELLQKPEPLTPQEYETIKKHPENGADFLAEILQTKSLVSIVLHHHAWYHGGGYPDASLNGNDIPFGARLVAVVDAFDAITTDRSYRKAQSKEEAIKIIKNGTPQQFDPQIVAAFLTIVEKL